MFAYCKTAVSCHMTTYCITAVSCHMTTYCITAVSCHMTTYCITAVSCHMTIYSYILKTLLENKLELEKTKMEAEKKRYLTLMEQLNEKVTFVSFYISKTSIRTSC